MTVFLCWGSVLILVLLVSVSQGSCGTLEQAHHHAYLDSGPKIDGNSCRGSLPDALVSSLASFATSGAAYEVKPITAVQTEPGRAGAPDEVAGSIHAAVAGNQQARGSGCSTAEPNRLTSNHLTPPHKGLWPLCTRDVATLLLTAITLFIAAGGGIGGGAVFVVLYVFVGGFTAPQAVALSNITILGGALANFLANTSRRHPSLDRPLIDWDLTMVMEPTTMLGALLGSYMNKLLPVWLTNCLLAALLILLTYKLLIRGVSTFRAETKQRRLQQQVQQEQQQDEEKQLLLQQQQQQPHKQKQRSRPSRYASAATVLQEPLLVADGDDGDIGVVSYGGAPPQLLVTVKAGSPSSLDHTGAWFDAGGPGDQQQGHQQNHHGDQQQQQHMVQEAAAAAAAVTPVGASADLSMTVVPVPPNLRPLNIMTSQQHLQEEHQEHRTPLSGRYACSSTGSGRLLSPCLQHHQQRLPLQAASGTGAGTASALLDQSDGSQVALLLPYCTQYTSCPPAAGLHVRDSGSRGCFTSCCSCLNPATLQLSTVQNYERQQLPWQSLLILFFLSAWVVISDTSKVATVCGSPLYWLIVLSIVPPCGLATLLVRQWLLAKTAVKEGAAAAAAVAAQPYSAGLAGCGAMGVVQHELPEYEAASPPPRAAAAAAAAAQCGKATPSGGIHWTPRNSLLYPLLCSAAGIVAGLFGVGGGIVKGPLMLELGVCPEVSAATSATMIMFTAGSAAVVYLNFGGVVHDYALALLGVGFLVTLLGQLCTIRLVKALGRRSVIIFMMATLMVLATVAASYQSAVAVEAAWRGPQGMWTWGSVCKQH